MSADFAHGTAEEDEFLLDITSMMESDAPGEASPDDEFAAADHTTGAQLRRRLVTQESIAELAATEKPSLLQRLLRRK
ncbi:hypothetical protein [Novosphingobium naphthalenivorans]|uniref:hypothetical protein n=1 Tax=Novosphingobium naphthalenivorans TaxID=273168 RepID=UPI00082A04FA|nr:hypothetical protein [Novosphingobium naphthalenivorans]